MSKPSDRVCHPEPHIHETADAVAVSPDDAVLAFRRDADLLEAQFRGLLEASPDATIVVNRRGQIGLVNSRAERLFGYTRDELLGQSVELLVPAQLRAEHRASRDGFSHHPRVRSMGAGLDLQGVCKDGTQLPLDISLSPLQTDAGVVTVCAIRDITDRRRADARFRDLLEAAPDAMVIVAADGTMVLVNAQTEALFGYPRAALLGQPVELLIPAGARDVHRHHRGRYAADPRPRAMGAGLNLYGLRSDGTEIPVEISLSPLDSDGGPLAIAAIRDVTQQRALAERAHLLVQEQAARFQAEEAVRTRNEFLSVAAHELKTPITSLRVFASLLLRQFESGGAANPDRVRVALETIEQQSDKLSRLVNQLLDVSRIEAGRLSLSWQRQDVMALVRAGVEAARATTAHREITLDGPAEAYAEVDGLRMEQVLTNLLDNAVKYSPDGGAIDVGVEATVDGDIRIVVRDHGIGVANEVRDAIFDRFYRVDETGPTSGLGLGLYICRQIVELHQGRIEAEPAPAGGTRFIVTIPARAEES